MYWCVQIGSLQADPETESKRAMHSVWKDEKDINKRERVLFSKHSFSFSHLPVLN